MEMFHKRLKYIKWFVGICVSSAVFTSDCFIVTRTQKLVESSLNRSIQIYLFG